jgi:hypothetical protein
MEEIDLPNLSNELSQEQAVLYFIKQMNIDKLNQILDNKEYQNYEKSEFLKLLTIVFNTFKNRGNTKLVSSVGQCIACKFGHKAYYLKGNIDNSHLEILIEVKNDKVFDIRECNSFKSNTETNTDFKKRIYIDKRKYIPN